MPVISVKNTDTIKPVKKPYSAPVLEKYGDVRDLTLGGSPNIDESPTGRMTFGPPVGPGTQDGPFSGR